MSKIEQLADMNAAYRVLSRNRYKVQDHGTSLVVLDPVMTIVGRGLVHTDDKLVTITSSAAAYRFISARS